MKKWSLSDMIYVKDNYEKISTHEISKSLGRTESSVKQLISNLKKSGDIPQKTQQNKLWSEEEIDFVVKNIGIKTHNEIAAELGRTYYALQSIIKSKGIKTKELKKQNKSQITTISKIDPKHIEAHERIWRALEKIAPCILRIEEYMPCIREAAEMTGVNWDEEIIKIADTLYANMGKKPKNK